MATFTTSLSYCTLVFEDRISRSSFGDQGALLRDIFLSGPWVVELGVPAFLDGFLIRRSMIRINGPFLEKFLFSRSSIENLEVRSFLEKVLYRYVVNAFVALLDDVSFGGPWIAEFGDRAFLEDVDFCRAPIDNLEVRSLLEKVLYGYVVDGAVTFFEDVDFGRAPIDNLEVGSLLKQILYGYVVDAAVTFFEDVDFGRAPIDNLEVGTLLEKILHWHVVDAVVSSFLDGCCRYNTREGNKGNKSVELHCRLGTLRLRR